MLRYPAILTEDDNGTVLATLRERKLHKATLANRLGREPPQVDRLLDLRHTSRLEQLEAALTALGKRIDVVIRDAS